MPDKPPQIIFLKRRLTKKVKWILGALVIGFFILMFASGNGYNTDDRAGGSFGGYPYSD